MHRNLENRILEKIEYSDTVSPICISDEKIELSGWGYIAGWGITKETGFQSHELLEATLPIFDTNKCNMRYGGKIDGETQFCAGYSKVKSKFYAYLTDCCDHFF